LGDKKTYWKLKRQKFKNRKNKNERI